MYSAHDSPTDVHHLLRQANCASGGGKRRKEGKRIYAVRVSHPHLLQLDLRHLPQITITHRPRRNKEHSIQRTTQSHPR